VVAALDPYLTDWLDLLLRWLHVVAAIVWVGTSFYFVALDNHLLPPEERRDEEEGVGGEAWEVHGGGFYRVQKYRVAPRVLPRPLHWFKWEAYTTWLSGFALFVVLYYAHADTYLVDRSVADLSTGAAIAISLALLAAAWLFYEALCRLLGGRELLLGASLAVAIALAAWGLSHLFGDRALPIQLGGMLGTIMAANVLFVIIPGHWELVRAKEAGREPDPAPGLRGKQRSVHNNYLTLPVVLAMIAPHFPFVYGRDDGWAVLVGLMAIGAWVRHFFNLRHAGRTVWAIPATAALATAGLAVVIRPDGAGTGETGEAAVPFATVQRIVERRCASCHSQNPTSSDFSAPPKGIALDTPAQIRAQARAIERQAVELRTMPLGNVTSMTDGERDVLGRWIKQGAATK
jgi:uncharacterized membrane protein